MSSNILPNLLILIEQLYNKYESNSHVLTKMVTILENLDKTLEDINNTQMNKTNKLDEITNDQKEFISKFFKCEREIFYISHNNQFFIYENHNFKLLNQNDLVIHIYTLINRTQNKELLKSKYTIENKIIKEIKKKPLYNVIPNSKTIQNTLQLFTPIIFDSKDITKYFLTTIGDIILKKKNKLNYYLCEYMESLISWISTSMTLYFGDIIHFKYKINLKDDSSNNRYFPVLNKNISLDVHNSIFNIYVLSCHYSNRFKNSENYLINKCKKKDRDKIMILTNLNNVTNEFIDKYFENKENSSISSKEMYFMWQYFIEEFNYPYIYNEKQLNVVLQEKLKFSNNYLNLSCTLIEEVNNFIKFIEKNCESSYEINEIFEIDEIITLYRDNNLDSCIQYLDDDIGINAILYFLPSYKVYGKYVGMKCSIWNKVEDIENFIKTIDNSEYSCNELYELYIKKNYKYKVDKGYFESLCIS